ncbi:MAG: ion transporter [Rhizobiales bacterium]|nr:ion transporter [Hyphomicrobiales bacterium]
MGRRSLARVERARRRCHFVLDGGASSDQLTRIVNYTLVALALASVAAVVLESEPDYAARFGFWFLGIEFVAVSVFTVEYALRLWTAPLDTRYADLSPTRARLAYARSPLALLDLMSILPSYLALFGLPDLGVLLMLRLARFFKLARYSPGMRSLGAALEAERRALFASAVILLGLVLVAASAMHVAEQAAQPDKFGSIPSSMWWAIVTLTTVGYGDVVPMTLAGKIIAGFTMIGGLMMLALPVGIVATAFAEEIHRQEFVVTWGMIARVPLFAALDAAEIAEIMHYLRAQTVPTGTVIVRRGEQADSMYFVAAGEVEVEVDPLNRVRLVEGHFFGEFALLRKTRRMATVRAMQQTKLLVLDAMDLQTLMDRNPDLGRHIEEIVRARMGDDVARTAGDMIPEEFEEPGRAL